MRHDANAQPDFLRAWSAWRRTPLPVDNVRRGRRGAPAFGVELRLDYLRSHVYALGSAHIEERPWDYAAMAADQLAELHRTETELDACPIPEEDKDPYRRYIDATRLLLHRLLLENPPRAGE